MKRYVFAFVVAALFGGVLSLESPSLAAAYQMISVHGCVPLTGQLGVGSATFKIGRVVANNSLTLGCPVPTTGTMAFYGSYLYTAWVYDPSSNARVSTQPCITAANQGEYYCNPTTSTTTAASGILAIRPAIGVASIFPNPYNEASYGMTPLVVVTLPPNGALISLDMYW